jgi:hypothetical protein
MWVNGQRTETPFRFVIWKTAAIIACVFSQSGGNQRTQGEVHPQRRLVAIQCQGRRGLFDAARRSWHDNHLPTPTWAKSRITSGVENRGRHRIMMCANERISSTNGEAHRLAPSADAIAGGAVDPLRGRAREEFGIDVAENSVELNRGLLGLHGSNQGINELGFFPWLKINPCSSAQSAVQVNLIIRGPVRSLFLLLRFRA